MKDIEELIENSKKYKNAVIQKRFISKKNTVCYVILNNKPRVLKWFAPGFKKNVETEYAILKKGASKLNIPTPLEKDEKNNVISMSYIIGENLCDMINDEKTTGKTQTESNDAGSFREKTQEFFAEDIIN